MKKTGLIVFLYCTLVPGHSIAFPEFFFNPGIKLCYEFGPRGGVAIGPEVSLGRFSESGAITGIVIGRQVIIGQERSRTYVEVEAGTPFAGGAIGAETATDEKEWHFRLRGFIGLFGYLSVKYSQAENPVEVGLVGKLPLFMMLMER